MTHSSLPSSFRCQRQRQRRHAQTQTPRRRPRPRTRPRPSFSFSFPLLAITLALSGASAEQNLTTAQVDIVVQRLNESALQSWEVGTQQQALIELTTPSFSVLNDSFIPPSQSLPSSLSPVIDSITQVIQNKTALVQSQSNLTSPQPFWPEDGSAADPASNGVAALIANWTGQEGVTGVDYDGAANEQMEYLWEKVPRTEDGALSHRVSQVQLWSDFVYMVPPFLAYYGVLTSNRTMVEEAYNQIKLYRSYLLSNSNSDSDDDDDNHQLWQHVVLGSDFEDLGLWSTGNGWVAAGMLRVLGTIQNSEYGNAMKSEIKDLRNWVDEIHDGMYSYMRDDGMFHNYANDSSSFVDAASAALLASTVYRHALLTSTYRYLPQAEFVRRALWAPTTAPEASFSADPSFSQNTSFVDADALTNMTHFDAQGWLTPVVNPHSFSQEGEKSAEAQAFVVMMYAAWRDWEQEGAVGANAARRARGDVPGFGVMIGVIVLGVGVGWGLGV
ncbi:hypothetical protein ACEPAF_2109 [Sanghuangporus sanghuang]